MSPLLPSHCLHSLLCHGPGNDSRRIYSLLSASRLSIDLGTVANIYKSCDQQTSLVVRLVFGRLSHSVVQRFRERKKWQSQLKRR